DHDWDIRCLCVVDGLYCLRHNAVVSCNHQDCQVSGLRTTGTHGGKRLVTRGIQEGNDALATIDINLGLVRTNALGNAAGLASAFIRPTDGIQQTSFTVVNVTHDGYDWRTLREVFRRTFIVTKLQVEGLKQLTVFIFWRNNLNVVVDLRAEQLQGLFRNRCGCSHHFTEVKQCLHQCRWIRIDLFSEIPKGGAATQTDGSPLAVWKAHATNYVCCAWLLVSFPLRRLRLLTAWWCAPGTAECTCRTAATSAASTGPLRNPPGA